MTTPGQRIGPPGVGQRAVEIEREEAYLHGIYFWPPVRVRVISGMISAERYDAVSRTVTSCACSCGSRK